MQHLLLTALPAALPAALPQVPGPVAGAPSSNGNPPDRWRLGAFVLDLACERLIGPDGRERSLRRQAFATLRLLAQRAPALVTTTELLATIWRRQAVSPSAVPQAIRAIRQALRGVPGSAAYIVAHPRRGYRLAATVVAIGAEKWWQHDGDDAPRAGGLSRCGVAALPAAANDDTLPGLGWRAADGTRVASPRRVSRFVAGSD